MVYQISQQDMDAAIASGRRGCYFARLGSDDYMGYANLDGEPIKFRGSLADVLDMFVPYNGVTVDVTRDTISPHVEEPPEDKQKKRKRR